MVLEKREVKWRGQPYAVIAAASPVVADRMAQACLNRAWKMLKNIDMAYARGWSITK